MTQGTQLGPATSQTTSLTEEAQSLATNVTQGVKDKAIGLVEQQKTAAAEQVDGVARLIEDVAEEAEKGAPIAAPYLRAAASSIHRVSSSLRERSTDDFLQDLNEFVRRRPATLIGASLVAGFALARFLKSSADRRAAARQKPSHPPGSHDRTPQAQHPRSDQRSEADLAGTVSPVAGMASLSNVAAPSAEPIGASAAGGGSEAPEPSKVGSI